MKKFIFKVHVSGTREYVIEAESKEAATDMFYEKDFDADESLDEFDLYDVEEEK